MSSQGVHETMLTKVQRSLRRESRPGRQGRSGRSRNLVGGCEQLEARTLLTSAATLHWTGGASNLWSDPANWQEHQAPAGGDDLIFPDVTTKVVRNDISGLSVHSLTILSADYELGGLPLSLT